MPRKSKITAVLIEPESVNQRVEESGDVKTDAEQMTDVLKEFSVEEQTAAAPEPAKAIAKPKRITIKKVAAVAMPIVEPVAAVEPSIDEIRATVTLPKEDAKSDVKVDCPDCGKKMSAKTLKYSHAPNCVAKKQKTAEAPTCTPRDDNATRDVSEEMIEHEVQRRMNGRRSECAARREEMVSKLIQNAF